MTAMKRKLLKQTLSQWRSNVWLTIELIIIIIVTWYIVDLLTQVYEPMSQPRGFDIEYCYKITTTIEEGDSSSTMDGRREVLSRLRAYPGVEGVAISLQGIEPYNGSMSSGAIRDVSTPDSISFGSSQMFRCIRLGYANPDFFRVFRIGGFRGESPEDMAEAIGRGRDKMVITGCFVELIDTALTISDPYTLLGHRFDMGGFAYELTGVAQTFKRDDTSQQSSYSTAVMNFDESIDGYMQYVGGWSDMTIRVRPEADKGFTDRFIADLDHFSAGDLRVTGLQPFDQVRKAREKDALNAVKQIYLILGFLLANVFLGILGTFWYRTRQRASELAVRMSFGASRASVFRRLMTEGIIVLTIAAVISGVLIAALLRAEIRPNMELMAGLDTVWIVRTSVITYLLLLVMIFIGIYFPARMAMRLDPAIVLKEE